MTFPPTRAHRRASSSRARLARRRATCPYQASCACCRSEWDYRACSASTKHCRHGRGAPITAKICHACTRHAEPCTRHHRRGLVYLAHSRQQTAQTAQTADSRQHRQQTAQTADSTDSRQHRQHRQHRSRHAPPCTQERASRPTTRAGGPTDSTLRAHLPPCARAPLQQDGLPVDGAAARADAHDGAAWRRWVGEAGHGERASSISSPRARLHRLSLSLSLSRALHEAAPTHPRAS
jgi:hypothetical protein